MYSQILPLRELRGLGQRPLRGGRDCPHKPRGRGRSGLLVSEGLQSHRGLSGLEPDEAAPLGVRHPWVA